MPGTQTSGLFPVTKMSELITPERILCDIDAHSKEHALGILAALLAEGPTHMTSSAILSSLNEHVRQNGFKPANGTVIPVGRASDLPQTIACLITLTRPVKFNQELPDVDILFGALMADDDPESSIEPMNELLNQPDVPEFLRNTNSPDDIYKILSSRLSLCA